MDHNFDLIVIGAGPGGYTAAEHAARQGLRVAVIERHKLGGCCINYGCIPTKAFIHASSLYSSLKNCGQFGLVAGETGFDFPAVCAYKDDAIARFRESVGQEFDQLGVVFIQGTAQIVREGVVSVTAAQGGKEVFRARHILIATGARAYKPPIPGIDLPGVVTSWEILGTPHWDYDQLVILGGGVVGVELASVFNAFGAKVTIIEQAPRLLGPMDQEISESLEKMLRRRGIDIYTEASATAIEQNADGRLCCRFRMKSGLPGQLEATRILAAAGRRAYLDGLTADGLTLETKDGRIAVDSNFQTSIPNVFAVGDVMETVQLAHLASAEGVCVVDKLCGNPPSVLLSTVPSCAFVELPVIPTCIHVNPEIASVGISEEQAIRHGISVSCGRYDIRTNGKAIISKESSGFIKLVFESHRKVLIGAQMMCPRASDMIGEMATAVANEMTARQLLSAMRAHPTFNEGIDEAIRDCLAKNR